MEESPAAVTYSDGLVWFGGTCDYYRRELSIDGVDVAIVFCSPHLVPVAPSSYTSDADTDTDTDSMRNAFVRCVRCREGRHEHACVYGTAQQGTGRDAMGKEERKYVRTYVQQPCSPGWAGTGTRSELDLGGR